MDCDVDKIAEEFLQVSSHLRLGIILHLEEKTDKLTSLAKKLDVTTSEIHRNLKRLSDDKFEQDRKMFEINALGVLWLTEAIIPKMMKNGGKI